MSRKGSYRFPDTSVICSWTFSDRFLLRIYTVRKVDLVGYLVVIDKVGEQADNGQYAENDFSCVHFFTFSTVREIFNGLDDEVNHCADG